MKILHALHGYPPDFVAGTELYVRRLAQEQGHAGHAVIIVAGASSRGDAADVIDQDGIRVFRIGDRDVTADRWDRTFAPWVEGRFARLLEEEAPDIVHVHHWLRLSRGLVRQARRRSIPCVVTAHDLFVTCPRVFRVRPDEDFCQRPLSLDSCLHCVPREPWMTDDVVTPRLEQFVADVQAELQAASLVIAPSRAHAALLVRFAGLAENRIEIVSHGTLIDGEGPPPSPEPWTPGCGRPLRVAHWGHLLRDKGVHVLLGAVRALPRPGDVELVLWGPDHDPEYARRLVRLCESLSVERRSRFHTADLRELRADLAVFPSLAHESHSFAVDEAFFLGLPVLVSARGALPERCGAAGASFPPGDESALASLLHRALTEPGWLASMRAAVARPLGFRDHWQRLQAIYARASEQKQSELVGHDGVLELERSERLARALERQARELVPLRGKLEERERKLAEQESNLASHRSELLRLQQELAQTIENFQQLIGEKDRDLAAHRRELERLSAALGQGIRGAIRRSVRDVVRRAGVNRSRDEPR